MRTHVLTKLASIVKPERHGFTPRARRVVLGATALAALSLVVGACANTTEESATSSTDAIMVGPPLPPYQVLG